MGWKPHDANNMAGEGAFLNWHWNIASDEERLIYFLAVGSPVTDHALDPVSYYRLKRVIKRPGGGFAPVLAFLGPVLDSTATGEVAKDSTGSYVVKVAMDDEMAALHDLVLELDETGTRIDGFSFNDGTGNKLHFRFYDQKWNPKLSPELFKFAPPEGMTVEE